jgi:hypothetical protein
VRALSESVTSNFPTIRVVRTLWIDSGFLADAGQDSVGDQVLWVDPGIRQRCPPTRRTASRSGIAHRCSIRATTAMV